MALERGVLGVGEGVDLVEEEAVVASINATVVGGRSLAPSVVSS